MPTFFASPARPDAASAAAGVVPTAVRKVFIQGFTHPVREYFLEDVLEMTGFLVGKASRWAKKKAKNAPGPPERATSADSRTRIRASPPRAAATFLKRRSFLKGRRSRRIRFRMTGRTTTTCARRRGHAAARLVVARRGTRTEREARRKRTRVWARTTPDPKARRSRRAPPPRRRRTTSALAKTSSRRLRVFSRARTATRRSARWRTWTRLS